jgi:hypothetical protein
MADATTVCRGVAGDRDGFLDQFNIHPRMKLNPEEVADLGLAIFDINDNPVPGAMPNVEVGAVAIDPRVPQDQ